MNHYVPLFEQIVDSSIWCESDLVVKVFLTMLAKRRKNGVVYGNAFNIAQWAKKSESEVLEALAILSAPDTRRLEPQPFQGRRVEKVEGGWLLLNAEHYQRLMVTENRRHANAAAQARYMERQKSEVKPECSTTHIQSIREGLCNLYARDPKDHWSYIEETALVDVGRRTGGLEELSELRDYQRLNAQFFPKSIESLLSNWTKTLDRARSHERDPSTKPAKTLIDKEIAAANRALDSLQ